MKIKTDTIILTLLNLSCVFFILQIEFKFFRLFSSNFNNETINAVNRLIIGIGIGIIVSTIFYLIVVAYPNYLKRKSSYKIIQPRLDTITNQLYHAINYFLEKRIPEGKNKTTKLLIQNFITIERLTSEKMNFKYKILDTHKEWIPFSSGERTEIDFFVHQKELVISKINEIFAIPTVIHLDEELLEVLAKLRDCSFYSGVDSFSKDGNSVTVNQFYKGAYDYYTFFLELKKYAKINKMEILD